MKLTKSQLKEIIRETMMDSLNEKIDKDKFHKATMDAYKVHSNISMKPNDIFDAVLAGLILDKGISGAKKWVKEVSDMYKQVYLESVNESILTEWSASEVLKQLGGNKFIAMTGAKNFVKDDSTKTIYFKIGRAKNGINYVRITLKGSDTYTMEFISLRGGNLKIVKEVNGVYNDQLQSIFTQYTGLDTLL
jgi:hypothetical protein